MQTGEWSNKIEQSSRQRKCFRRDESYVVFRRARTDAARNGQYFLVFGPLLVGIIFDCATVHFQSRRTQPVAAFMDHRCRIDDRRDDRDVVGGRREITLVTQFQGPTVVGVSRGRNQWSDLHRRAIVSRQGLLELPFDRGLWRMTRAGFDRSE
jgi:hypothetical protein